MEYEVEAILNHFITNSGRLFEVKWKNYDHAENTIEPEQHLLDSWETLSDYLAAHSLPPTPEDLPQLLSDDEAEEENRANFITAERVLKYVNLYSNLSAYSYPLSVESFRGQPLDKERAILLLFKEHFYVLVNYRGQNYIMDGENRCKDELVREKIQQLVGSELLVVEFHGQCGDDHCGSSSVAMILELKRLLKCNIPLDREIRPAPGIVRYLARKLHPHTTVRLKKERYIPKKPKCSICGKGFMSETKLRHHFRVHS